MKMEVKDLEGGVKQVELEGRLDTIGVGEVESRFNAAIVSAGKSAIVDLSKVDFITTMGIRMLTSAAKHLNESKAKIAVYAPSEFVSEILDAVSLDKIVPICKDM